MRWVLSVAIIIGATVALSGRISYAVFKLSKPSLCKQYPRIHTCTADHHVPVHISEKIRFERLLSENIREGRYIRCFDRDGSPMRALTASITSRYWTRCFSLGRSVKTILWLDQGRSSGRLSTLLCRPLALWNDSPRLSAT